MPRFIWGEGRVLLEGAWPRVVDWRHEDRGWFSVNGSRPPCVVQARRGMDRGSGHLLLFKYKRGAD